MAATVFNQILVMMTAFDTLYLLTAVTEFAFVESFHLSLGASYDALFVYFLYPVHNVALCCSILSHVLLAFERYLAVCYPQLVYAAAQKKRRMGGAGGSGAASTTGTLERSTGKRAAVAVNSANNAVRKKARACSMITHLAKSPFIEPIIKFLIHSLAKFPPFPQGASFDSA